MARRGRRRNEKTGANNSEWMKFFFRDGKMEIQGSNYNNIDFRTGRGLRGNTAFSRPTPKAKAQQTSRVQRSGVRKDAPKLFTKDFDARKKIDLKRQKEKKKDEANQAKADTKAQLRQSRTKQKDVSLSKKREMSMFGDKMQIVSKLEADQERKTVFTGTSLRVTTLQTTSERSKHRDANQSGDSILITAARDRDESNESQEDMSEYSAFEARRKAKQEAKLESEHPKPLSLNPISRPKRPPPVYEHEEEHGNSSKLLISNLHPNVSQDDIYELFAAIAPVRSVRLIRQGVAEVVYNNHQDALIAHKKYHSRNLDGQPMICKFPTSEQPVYMPPSARQPRGGIATSTSPVVFTVKI